MAALNERPPNASRRVLVARVLAIVLLTTLAYIPALQGGFVWDDDDYVTENWTLRSVDGLRAIWLEPQALPQYYPLVHTSFWIEYHVWGLQPFGFHLTNVLLHAAVALLFWRLLCRLRVPGAYFAAVLFALHPVHVESVAWITERKNVLSGLCYLGAALAYLRFQRADIEASGADAENRFVHHWRWYGVAGLLFLCALFSKTVTSTWPAAMLLVLWWRFGRVRTCDIARLAPFFVIGVGMGLVTAWLEVHHVRAEGAEWDLTLLERCLVAGRVPWFYFAKLVWPAHLCFVYPRWQPDAYVWWQYLFPSGLLIVIAMLWFLRSRIGRGPVVACLFFCGTLFPALGFLNVYPMRFSFVADHFQYHASFGVIAALAATLHCAFRYVSEHRPTSASPADRPPVRGIVTTTASIAVVLALGVTTWRQASNYRSLETLWRATLAQNPSAWIAHTNLGLVLVDQGKLDEALTALDRAFDLDPENAEVRLALGFAFLRTGRLPEAYEELSRAIALRPSSARGHALLGAVQARRSQIANAIEHYREALRLQPDALAARSELAFMLWNEGFAEEAVVEYETLLAYDPHNTDAMIQLALALRAAGRSGEALNWLQRAVQLRPELADVIRRGQP